MDDKTRIARTTHRLLQHPPLQENPLLPRQIRRFEKPQRAELHELQPAGHILLHESRLGGVGAFPQGHGADPKRQIPTEESNPT